MLATRRINFFEFGHRPSWSPDGRSIAVRSDRTGKDTGIELFPLNGGEPRFIREPFWPLYVEWLRDDSGIVFGGGGLWFQPLPNGTLRRVTSDESDYRYLTATMDPNALVAVQERYAHETWILQLNQRGISAQVPTGEDEIVLGWLSNNDLLLTNWTRLSRLKLDGSGRAVLLERPSIAEASACGDRAIIFRSYEQPRPRPQDSRASGFIMNSDGSGLRKLDFGDSVSCSDDGKWIAYKTEKGDIGVMSAATGASRVIIEHKMAGRGFSISPDGKRILYAKPSPEDNFSSSSFVVTPVEGQEPSRTVELAGQRVRFAGYGWTPDGNSVAYATGDPRNLWVLPLSGGPPRRITNFGADELLSAITSFSWSPDGKKLAITRSKRSVDVVMIRQNAQ